MNICANKLCAILGRDDPKDMFDLHTVFEHGQTDRETAMDAAARKCVLDPRAEAAPHLSSFGPSPAQPLDHKDRHPGMADHVLEATRKRLTSMI